MVPLATPYASDKALSIANNLEGKVEQRNAPKPFEGVEKVFWVSANLFTQTKNQQLRDPLNEPKSLCREFFNTLVSFRPTETTLRRARKEDSHVPVLSVALLRARVPPASHITDKPPKETADSSAVKWSGRCTSGRFVVDRLHFRRAHSTPG